MFRHFFSDNNENNNSNNQSSKRSTLYRIGDTTISRTSLAAASRPLWYTAFDPLLGQYTAAASQGSITQVIPRSSSPSRLQASHSLHHLEVSPAGQTMVASQFWQMLQITVTEFHQECPDQILVLLTSPEVLIQDPPLVCSTTLSQSSVWPRQWRRTRVSKQDEAILHHPQIILDILHSSFQLGTTNVILYCVFKKNRQSSSCFQVNVLHRHIFQNGEEKS